MLRFECKCGCIEASVLAEECGILYTSTSLQTYVCTRVVSACGTVGNATYTLVQWVGLMYSSLWR